jgi:hypothetical protein
MSTRRACGARSTLAPAACAVWTAHGPGRGCRGWGRPGSRRGVERLRQRGADAVQRRPGRAAGRAGCRTTTIVANMSFTSRPVSSPRRRLPRCGPRRLATWSAQERDVLGPMPVRLVNRYRNHGFIVQTALACPPVTGPASRPGRPRQRSPAGHRERARCHGAGRCRACQGVLRPARSRRSSRAGRLA